MRLSLTTTGLLDPRQLAAWGAERRRAGALDTAGLAAAAQDRPLGRQVAVGALLEAAAPTAQAPVAPAARLVRVAGARVRRLLQGRHGQGLARRHRGPVVVVDRAASLTFRR